jgi:hypothetical protein
MTPDDPRLIALLERIADALDRAHPTPAPEIEPLIAAHPGWTWVLYQDQIVGLRCHVYALIRIKKRCNEWHAEFQTNSGCGAGKACATPLEAVRILMETIR